MSEFQENDKECKDNTWKNLLDKVIDIISSKSTLQMLNAKQGTNDCKKHEASKQDVKEIIRKKLLKELLKGDRSECDKLEELHVNEAFKEGEESCVRCSSVHSEPLHDKSKESTRQRRTSISFLDEQYNLTKQAIARRYRPQVKLNSVSPKDNAMRDYLNGPFTEELHRISNVMSERIQANGVSGND